MLPKVIHIDRDSNDTDKLKTKLLSNPESVYAVCASL